MSRRSRFLRFQAVSALGVGVNLGALLLLRRAGLDLALAAALAVEVAIVHNFLWHERFTFADRPSRRGWRPRLHRLLRFHALNGLVSLAGASALAAPLAHRLHLPDAVAVAFAMAASALVNFLLGDRLVFRPDAVVREARFPQDQGA